MSEQPPVWVSLTDVLELIRRGDVWEVPAQYPQDLTDGEACLREQIASAVTALTMPDQAGRVHRAVGMAVRCLPADKNVEIAAQVGSIERGNVMRINEALLDDLGRAILALKHRHSGTFDHVNVWESCPLIPPAIGPECNCGTQAWNARIDAILALITPAPIDAPDNTIRTARACVIAAAQATVRDWERRRHEELPDLLEAHMSYLWRAVEHHDKIAAEVYPPGGRYGT